MQTHHHGALSVSVIPILQDNYLFMLADKQAGIAAAIDPALAAPVLQWCEENSLTLTDIFITHHHGDHTGGIRGIMQAVPDCRVTAYAPERRIPQVTHPVVADDDITFGTHQAKLLFMPAHTLGHVAYYFEQAQLLFSGDVIFSCGCGRLFEGTPGQMYKNLAYIRGLPEKTTIYAAHEYTQANIAFALTVEPENAALQSYAAAVAQRRQQGEPTIPTSVAQEKAVNPFLRWDSAEIRATLAMPDAPDEAVFAELRRRKDRF